MYRTRLTVVVGLWFAVQTSQSCFAQVSFADMLGRVPGDANALVMIDADKIRSSPFARTQAKSNVHQHMILPEVVDRVVLASNLDIASLKPISEVAIVSIKEKASMAKIADTRGGKLENFGEESGVWLPDNSYLVSLGLKLGDLGAAIEDLNAWTARVEGKTVFLSGTFSVDALRKVLSIVEPPPLPVQQPSPGQRTKSPSERDPMAYPTYDHYKATQVLITDLRKTNTLTSSGSCALWYERYAKKIDQLPIVNVDPDLLDFTAELAVSLRGLAGTYRQAGTRLSQYSSNPTTQWVGGYTGGFGAYGGYGYGSGYYRTPGVYVAAKKTGPSPRSWARRQGRSNASQVRTEKFQVLDEGMAKMRRSLTEKYGLEF